jgi:hypothetical protein
MLSNAKDEGELAQGCVHREKWTVCMGELGDIIVLLSEFCALMGLGYPLVCVVLLTA